MRSIKVLIVEDKPTAATDLETAMRIAGKKLNIKLEFSFAKTTADARQMVHNHCFHGVSIDQNLPRTSQGEVSREIGQEFISELETWDPPSFTAIFTAYPSTPIANFAGAKAQIPYIVKSTRDRQPDDEDHQYMTFLSYGEYFLREIRSKYVLRVLKLVTESGFLKLHQLAHDTSSSYGRFLTTSFQDENAAKDFFSELSKFREHFNLALVSFSMGIAAEKTLTPYPNPTENPSRIETWLSKQWRFLETHASMGWIKSYFHLTGGQTLTDYYIKACASLREKRNPAIHNNWIFAPEDFDKQLYDIFCFFDVVGWLMRTPLITQPFKREQKLVYTDLNNRQATQAETPFNGKIPEAPLGRVFTLLGEDGSLLPLDKGFSAERDKATNRLQLKQAVCL